MNKKPIYLLLLLFPLLLAGWGAAYITASGPFITDEALEEAVRIEIDYPRGEIRPDQVEEIQELRFRDAGITSLEGIDEFTSLVSLDVRDNQIEDISVLSELESLTSLNLRGNQITDISPLTFLTNLRELNLRENQITDISPLSALYQLEDLNIRHNQIENIEPLRGLDDLRERLYVEENPIRDFTPVQHYVDEINDTDIEENALSPAPEFSHEAGFYEEELEVALTAVSGTEEIYYTLDGSAPDPFSEDESTLAYTGPILVSGENEENLIASIRTNLLEDENSSRNWIEPPEGIAKAAVIKAVSVNTEDNSVSSVVTNTYFINKDYSLPVFSLSTDAAHFFSEETGIYVPGVYHDPDAASPDATGNFEQRGREWERPIHVEYFEDAEERTLAQDAGVRIHGGFTRRFPQKTLRLYARNDYGENLFAHSFFPEEDRNEFKRLLLRQSGNDWGGTMFNDALMQRLVSHTELETQAYQPSLVFLNGEYWGIHNIRERYDQHYFETKYDLDREDLVILEADTSTEGNVGVDTGSPGDVQHYQEMLTFIEENDMSSEEHYEHVQTLMDIDNFISYQVFQIYFKNTDWPQNNINFYRMKTAYDPNEPAPYDGRWRWLLYDTDHGFAYHGPDAYEEDTMTHAAREDEWSTSLFRNLLANEEFEQQFLNEFAGQLNSSFAEARVLEEIEEVQAGIAPEINEHIERWGQPESRDAWEQLVEDTRTFASNRPEAVREHLQSYFELSGTAEIAVNYDSSRGSVFVNTLEISSDTIGIADPENWSGTYFEGVPVTVTAVPAEGYTFAGWSGDTVENSETIEITPEGNISLEALFE